MHNFCPATSKKALGVQGEMQCSGDIYGAVMAPRMFLLYSPFERPGFQDHRKGQTRDVLKWDVLFPVTQMTAFTLLSFSFELSINSTFRMLHPHLIQRDGSRKSF